MNKEELLQELQKENYITLKPSPVHGIGVFALKDIPKGCRTIFSKGETGWIKLSFEEVEQLPAHSRNQVETYCLYNEEHYYVPEYGFKLMDLALYINHSSDPNIISVNEGEHFEALRNIKEGEELLVNYETIATGLESYE